MAEDQFTLNISADTSSFRKEVEDADRLAQGLGRSLSQALEGAATRGRTLEQVVSQLGLRLSRMAVDAAFKPVEQGLGSLFQSAFQGLGNSFAGGGGSVMPFAQGGVISSPVGFPLAGGMGLAGEAGPEAILPLARGADGRLGVRGAGSARSGSVVNVHITTPDASSFRRSEAYVSQMIARAVGRGERSS